MAPTQVMEGKKRVAESELDSIDLRKHADYTCVAKLGGVSSGMWLGGQVGVLTGHAKGLTCARKHVSSIDMYNNDVAKRFMK